MPSEPSLDIEALLVPISEDAPSGPSLREHPELSRNFYEVREARKAALDAEKALAQLALVGEQVFGGETSGRSDESRQSPDWGRVADLAIGLLSEHTKDLWIVAWLIEALTREAGIAGFRDGLKLCREMSEKFWDTIHPRPDEDDGYGHTVAQLAGLDAALAASLDNTQVLLDDPRLTWAAYRMALDIDKMDPEARTAALEDGAVSLQEYSSALRNAPRQDLLDLQQDLEQALEECKTFSETMDRLCGKDDSGYPLGPSTSNLQRGLERLKHDFAEMTAGLLEDASQIDPEAAPGELTASAADNHAALAQRPVASRDEALQHLLRVADFFRKTEPHSPVSYALEQAVRWGRMPLPDLLKDLVGDQDVLAQVFKRMGIVGQDGDESGSEEYN